MRAHEIPPAAKGKVLTNLAYMYGLQRHRFLFIPLESDKRLRARLVAFIAEKGYRRERERRERCRRRDVALQERYGDGEICTRCHATLATYQDACSAPLEEPCPGFQAIEDALRDVR